MRVLLFTHSQDIDGLGNALLASKAFNELKYVPVPTFDITRVVSSYVDSKEIYDYDLVFVTDLCIKEPLLSRIDKDQELKGKFLVLDHHASEIKEGNDAYDFVNITVSKNGILTCGTSLFYDYLVDNGYLSRTDTLDEFVELTRQYDTWDWKKNNNLKARKLHIVFETQGLDAYLSMMMPILDKETLELPEEVEDIVSAFDDKFRKDAEEILGNMKVTTVSIEDIDYRVGYVYCEYKYRNDLNELVQKNNVNDIDVLGMIMTDKDTVSYRQIREVDCSIIASSFGGKGHVGAGSNPQDNEKFKQLIKRMQ